VKKKLFFINMSLVSNYFRHCCLVLGLGGASALAAAAQTSPLASPPDSLAARSDTAAALHRLFVAKRHIRTAVVLGTGGGFLLAGAVGNIFGQENYGSYGGDEVRIFNLAVLAVPVLGAELLVFGEYSRRHERLATEDLRAHRLSPHLKRILAPKYFQPLPAK